MRLASPSENCVAPEVDLCRAVLYVLTPPPKDCDDTHTHNPLAWPAS